MAHNHWPVGPEPQLCLTSLCYSWCQSNGRGCPAQSEQWGHAYRYDVNCGPRDLHTVKGTYSPTSNAPTMSFWLHTGAWTGYVRAGRPLDMVWSCSVSRLAGEHKMRGVMYLRPGGDSCWHSRDTPETCTHLQYMSLSRSGTHPLPLRVCTGT